MRFSTANFFLLFSVSDAFLTPSRTAFAPRCVTLVLREQKDADDLGKQAASLLGDIASAVAGKAKEGINTLTDKEEFEFGDLSKWVNKQAQAIVSEMTDKEEADLGDLTKWVDGRLKELGTQEWVDGRLKELKSSEEVKKLVENLEMLGKSEDVKNQLEAVVGKETTDKLADIMEGEDIELGEISKTVSNEVLELVKNRDYTISDYILLFKILTALGLSLNPLILSAFPLNLLLQLYNASLVQEVSSHIAGALALEVDKRAKQAFTVELEKQTKKAVGIDPDADVGEIFKKAILDKTGKDSYDFGDVTRMLQAALEEDSPAEMEELMIGESSDTVEELDSELAADTEVLQEALVVEAETSEEKSETESDE